MVDKKDRLKKTRFVLACLGSQAQVCFLRSSRVYSVRLPLFSAKDPCAGKIKSYFLRTNPMNFTTPVESKTR